MMEPIPAYARVLGTLLGVLAVPMLGFGVLAGTISALVTTAHVHRTTTYAVADAPRLRLDVQYGHVVIDAGADGRIVVDDDHTAGSITRAAAGWAVNQARVSISQEANGVSVRTTGSLNPVLAVNWSRELRVQVPARTDLDVTSLGSLVVSGVDGNVLIRGRYANTTLRHVSLRGSSIIDGGIGAVRLDDVTVSGTTNLKSQVGGIVFAGSLAPGGNSLNIDAGGPSNVTITLPHPTDARAVVASNRGNLNADPIWQFTPARGALTRTWSADLSRTSSGSISVTTDGGNINFAAR
jgi:hypothetical protein